MKKIVLVCGLIAGIIVSALMVISIAYCYRVGNFEGNMVLGYATMLLAFSMVFVGIKNYRDKHNHGVISFGKAFKIGLYISLIASSVYVIVWLIDYYLFIPDFMDKYANAMLEQARAAGKSEAEMAEKASEMANYKEMYKNPLIVILFTFLEVLPVGLIVTLISALILKRNRQEPSFVA